MVLEQRCPQAACIVVPLHQRASYSAAGAAAACAAGCGAAFGRFGPPPLAPFLRLLTRVYASFSAATSTWPGGHMPLATRFLYANLCTLQSRRRQQRQP